MGSVTVIYDTNTLISAYGFDGKPEDAIKIGFYDAVEVAVSTDILSEYERVLGYDHLPFTEEDQSEIVPEFRLLTGATRVRPDVDLAVVDDDPDDDKFLELAVETNAKYLLSGDDHLADLETFQGTRILPAHEFLQEFDSDPPDRELRSE